MATNKSKLLYVLILILIVAAAYMYFFKNNVWRSGNENNAGTMSGNIQTISNNGAYVNEKYGFGLLFPSYWKDVAAQEKAGGVQFGLRDKNGQYMPIFMVRSYPDDEYEKLLNQQNSDMGMPYFIAYNNGNDYVYYMLAGDDKRADFGEPFSSKDYKGFAYDIENNITPTFKFVNKDNAEALRKNYRSSNEFRLTDIKPGDKVGDMTVKSVEPFDKNSSDDSGKLYVSNVSVKFSGETTVTGNYENRPADPASNTGGLVCMRGLDDQSRSKIPSLLWSENEVRFCFSNQDEAKAAFSPVDSSGKATVVIDDYTINKFPSNVIDVARLVRVVEKK